MERDQMLSRLEVLSEQSSQRSPSDPMQGTWTAGINLMAQLAKNGPGHSSVQSALEFFRRTREEANVLDMRRSKTLRQGSHDFCEAVELAVMASREWGVCERKEMNTTEGMEEEPTTELASRDSEGTTAGHVVKQEPLDDYEGNICAGVGINGITKEIKEEVVEPAAVPHSAEDIALKTMENNRKRRSNDGEKASNEDHSGPKRSKESVQVHALLQKPIKTEPGVAAPTHAAVLHYAPAAPQMNAVKEEPDQSNSRNLTCSADPTGVHAHITSKMQQRFEAAKPAAVAAARTALTQLQQKTQPADEKAVNFVGKKGTLFTSISPVVNTSRLTKKMPLSGSHGENGQEKASPSASSSPNRLKCEECDMQFTDSFKRAHHMISQHKDKLSLKPKTKNVVGKQHPCKLCPRIFNCPSLLKDHQAHHTGVLQHRCSQCPRAFLHACALNTHMKTDHGLLPHGCGTCGERFYYADELKKHQKSH